MTSNGSGHKRHQRLKLLRAYLKKEEECPGLPLFVTISPTSRCNLNCPMCPRAVSEFANRDIDFSLFRKIIDEGAPYFEFVYLMGGGEPLLNPEIFDMVRYCNSRGLRTGFSTNATLLRGERIEEALDSGLDYIILAFDGATPETYEKYRPGARFDVTRQNILTFLQRKIERKSKISVTVQMVRLPDNQPQIRSFMELWSIPGVDSVRVKEDELGIEGVSLESGAPVLQRRNPCHFLWQGPIYIEENGDVFPCCYMWTGEPVGNVGEASLMEIWNNDRMRALRRAHLQRELEGQPLCVGCRAPRPKLPLIMGGFLVDTYRVRRLIPLAEKISRRFGLPLFEDKSS